jgi:5-methylcytosine-specific restriction protein A
MPSAPLRYCLQRGCNARVSKGYCSDCAPKNDAGVHYGRKWGKARLRFLAEHPFCVECEKAGAKTLATDVDHIIPHRGSAAVFWRESNWQPLCHSCHSAKTATEGGFVGG